MQFLGEHSSCMVGLDIAEKPGMFSEEQIVVCLSVKQTGKSGSSKNLKISYIFVHLRKARHCIC
jgi:hypothetical protein